jgi:hypothetical protein
MSGIAVAATGIVVSTGVLAGHDPSSAGAALALSTTKVAPMTATELASREESASRSTGDRRSEVDATKAQALSNASGVAVTQSEDLTVADPQALARALMPAYGLSISEFSCLDYIWTQESGWDLHAENPSSGAYGIPQALPGDKMASAGANWRDSAETQIRWGLGYIKERYGSACAAASFKRAHGSY